MAWPPTPLPNDRTNATPQLDNHPEDHNDIANTLAVDFVPQVSDNLAATIANAANIISGDAAVFAAALVEQFVVIDLVGDDVTTTSANQTTNEVELPEQERVGVVTLTASLDVFVTTAGEDTFVGRLLAAGTPLDDELIWRPRGLVDERLTLTKTWTIQRNNVNPINYFLQVRQIAGTGAFTVGGEHTTLRAHFIG